MRLVLVHGIANENNSPDTIEKLWTSALYDAWERDGLTRPSNLNITTAYYANILANFSQPPKGTVTAGDARPALQTEFALLQEYATASNLSVDEIVDAARKVGVDLSLVEAGIPHEGWVIGFSRALEATLPTKGKYLVRLFLKQAAVYLERKGVQAAIKSVVREQIFKSRDPMVIVAHSLGTVIAYELLLEQASSAIEVPLFCTLGSPLAVAIVTNYLGKRPNFPRPPIARWINGIHRHDFVTLGRTLDKSNMGFEGIDNDETILNDDDDKHDVLAYISTASIASGIHTALTS